MTSEKNIFDKIHFFIEYLKILDNLIIFRKCQLEKISLLSIKVGIRPVSDIVM